MDPNFMESVSNWLSPKGHRKVLEVTDLGKLFLESILGIHFN